MEPALVIKDVKNYLADFEVVIGYEPLPDELPWQDFITNQEIFIIPPDKQIDPFTLADELNSNYRNKSVVILVPGHKFDSYGNRIGRGGGWYDRFLGRLPNSWAIVGMCPIQKLSQAALTPNPWDQSVQLLYIGR